jgi:hypothetical protein
MCVDLLFQVDCAGRGIIIDAMTFNTGNIYMWVCVSIVMDLTITRMPERIDAALFH